MVFTPETDWHQGLLKIHRSLIHLRHTYPALRTGQYRVLSATRAIVGLCPYLGRSNRDCGGQYWITNRVLQSLIISNWINFSPPKNCSMGMERSNTTAIPWKLFYYRKVH